MGPAILGVKRLEKAVSPYEIPQLVNEDGSSAVWLAAFIKPWNAEASGQSLFTVQIWKKSCFPELSVGPWNLSEEDEKFLSHANQT